VPIWAGLWGGGSGLAVPVTVVWGERLVGKQRSLVSSSLRFNVGGVVDQSRQGRCCKPEHDPRNTSPVDCARAHLARLSGRVQRRVLDHDSWQGTARFADESRLGVLSHIRIGVDSVASFHHDFTIVDKNGSKRLIPSGSGFDCKFYGPTKKAGIVLREVHTASVSESGQRLALSDPAHIGHRG
jgi:hypothetical protein